MLNIPAQQFWDSYHHVINENDGEIKWKEVAKLINVKRDKKQKEINNKFLSNHHKHLCSKLPRFGLPNIDNSCFLNCAIHLIRTIPYMTESIMEFDCTAPKLRDDFGCFYLQTIKPENEQIEINEECKANEEYKENESNEGNEENKDKIKKKKVRLNELQYSLMKQLQNVLVAMDEEDDLKKEQCIDCMLDIIDKWDNNNMIAGDHNGCHEVLCEMLDKLCINQHFESILNAVKGHKIILSQCVECKYTKKEGAKITSIGVPTTSDQETISEVIYNHTRPEWMSGNNKIWCIQCRKKTVHQRQILLAILPTVLFVIVHQWNNDMIYNPIPMQSIDFNDALLSQTLYKDNDFRRSRPRKYVINGVVLYDHHSDTSSNDAGHYRSFNYNHIDAKWMYFNDEECAPAKIEHVIKAKGAYIVCYIDNQFLDQYRVFLQQRAKKKEIAIKSIKYKNRNNNNNNNNKLEHGAAKSQQNISKSKAKVNDDISSIFDAVKAEMIGMSDEGKIGHLSSKKYTLVTKLLNYASLLKIESNKKWVRLLLYDGETKKNGMSNKIKNLINRYNI